MSDVEDEVEHKQIMQRNEKKLCPANTMVCVCVCVCVCMYVCVCVCVCVYRYCSFTAVYLVPVVYVYNSVLRVVCANLT